MKATLIAASALLGAAAAAQHKAHNGFHLRRGGYADNEICTVYTTVYVTASELPPVVSNTTVIATPSPVPETSCTESEAASTTPVVYSLYTPPAPSSAEVSSTEVYTPPPPPPSSKAPEPSSEAQPSKEAYTPAPPPAYTPAPVPSSSKVVEAPKPSAPAEAPKPSAPAEAPKPSAPAEAPKPSAPAEAPKPSAPAEAPKPSSSKVEESPKPEPTKPSGGSYSSTGRIVTKGKKWAITYTPYAADGQCKSAGEVKSDIAKIADMGFTTIRSYSTDCGVFENVIPECEKHGLKVIYGIFLEAGGKGGKGVFSDYANSQLQDIIDNAPKDSIAMIIVGNEAMFNNYVEASDLGAYIDYVREQLQGAGFPSDIAVTTTEPVNVWEEKGAALCSHIDIFAVQVHPFFTSKIEASEAGDFAAEQLEQAAKVCPEAAAKGKYITEIGWPKSGQSNGLAIPGLSEQKKAIDSIVEKVGVESCLFSFQDDLWKNPGAFGVEQSFGCADVL